MAPSVVIIGASGTVGRPLVQEFLKNKTGVGRIAVLADPTKVSRFTDVQSQGVEVVVGSFLEANSYKGFDTVISLTGNTALKLQPGMIDAAIAAGVRHFYPSELGTDSYVAIGKRRYFRDKIATREHLRDRAREVPGFAYTLLMTGAFTEFVPTPFNNVDIENHTAGSYGGPDALISVTALPEYVSMFTQRKGNSNPNPSIVRYVVESVLLPLEQGKSCRELRVAGETLTWATLFETLGEVQGVKYNATYLDPREAAEKEEAARVTGNTINLLLRCVVTNQWLCARHSNRVCPRTGQQINRDKWSFTRCFFRTGPGVDDVCGHTVSSVFRLFSTSWRVAHHFQTATGPE